MKKMVEVRFRLPEKLYEDIEEFAGVRGERVGIFARHVFVDAYSEIKREEARKDAILAGSVFPSSEEGEKGVSEG
jgi:hypothetical protein